MQIVCTGSSLFESRNWSDTLKTRTLVSLILLDLALFAGAGYLALFSPPSRAEQDRESDCGAMTQLETNPIAQHGEVGESASNTRVDSPMESEVASVEPGAQFRVPAASPQHIEANEAETALTEKEHVRVPLALLEPNPGRSVSEDEATGLETLRRQFVETVGGVPVNPADPEYRRRWEQAQPASDEMFYTLFGAEAFNQRQNSAGQDFAPASSP